VNVAEIAAALGSAGPEDDGWRYFCSLANEHNRTGGEVTI
jgi:hypothetical protein